MNKIVGSADIVFITFDTLRYDVAQTLWQHGLLPNLSNWISPNGWERRHSPGSFTYAAHQAFFAGFLPTPALPGKHPRRFACRFAGSETTTSDTFCFETANLVEGLAAEGYFTCCIGGVGFFNKKTALSRVFTDLFQESYWEERFGVTEAQSTQFQLEKAAEILDSHPEKIFLFINISALHQPNYFYLEGQTADDINSHAAALQYIDSQMPILMQALAGRRDLFVICCGDHGTTYGEDGYTGHRVGHEKVWEVPYLEGYWAASK